MLIGVDPLINPDLLHALASMGHGDEIAIVDTNFPALTAAGATIWGTPLDIGANAPRALRAILSLLPLDTFVESPVATMEVVGEPDAHPQVRREAQAEIDRAAGRATPIEGVERFAFYERASRCFAIVATAERRFYGNFLIRKGVIGPEVEPLA